MRVLAIRGANLASLAGEFEVRLDADPLASAGLFAITGPTGAGKSTLLDALCVALYDKTPRLCARGGALIGHEGEPEEARISATDVRALLSRGAGAGYAEVDVIGKDGRALRARWDVRRARERATGRLQPQTMAIRDLATDKVEAGPKSEILATIESRVGLSFEQFRRSVLLPQGDFAAFLRAPPQDRAALLERMTGTEIYGRVSAAAYRRAADEEKKLAAMAEAAARHAILDDGAREALEGERARLAAARDGAKKALVVAEARALWHARAGELSGAERKARSRLAAAEKAVAESAPVRAELYATEAAMALSGDLERADAAAAARDAVTAEIARRQRESDDAEAAHRQAGQRYEAAQAAIASACAAAEEEARRARQAHAAALFAAEAKAARAAEHPIDDVRAERDGLLAARERLRAVALAAQDCVAAESERAGAKSEAALALDHADRLANEAEKLAVEAQRTAGAMAEAEHNLDEARRRESLAGHRHSLRDGEPCPLCGSADHPWADAAAALSDAAIAAGERVDKLIAHRREIDQQLADTRAELFERRRAHALMTARAGDAEARKRAAAEAFAAASEGWGQLSGLEDAADPRTVAWLEAKLAGMAQDLAALAEREAEAAALFREASLARGTAEARRVDREHADDRVTEARGRTADAEKAALDGQAMRLASARAVLAAARDRLEEADATAEAGAENLARALAAANTTSAELRARLERGRPWIEGTRVAIAALDAAFSEARAVAAERAGQVRAHAEGMPAGCVGDDACAERCAAAVIAAAAAADATAGDLSRIESALLADDAARAQRAAMTAEIADRRESLAAYKMLAELIGSADGRKLRVFAQSLTLDALILHANDHLSDLCPRYRLARVPGRDLDLQVIDGDLGDEVRSLHSLSGGETFLTALALALALASLSALDMEIGSLLIDEGFGSLDVDTLDVALSVLEALHAGGRQVGLISHVPGIAERIGAQVKVTPRGGGKSAVRVIAG